MLDGKEGEKRIRIKIKRPVRLRKALIDEGRVGTICMLKKEAESPNFPDRTKRQEGAPRLKRRTGHMGCVLGWILRS